MNSPNQTAGAGAPSRRSSGPRERRGARPCWNSSLQGTSDEKLVVRRRPITTEAIGSTATHPSLRGALATKQSRGHNMRGASNPDDRTAAPGLLPATRARGRNDGQGIGSLVSACRVSLATARREVDRAIDQRRLDAPDRHIHPNSPNLETAPGAVDDALERADLNAADRRSRGTARSSAITDQRFRRHRDIDRRNCRRSSEAENYPARKALKTLKTGKSTRRRRAQSTMRWSVPTSTRRIGRSRGWRDRARSGAKRCGAVAISTITIVAAVRARRKFSWPQSLENTQNREGISICLHPLPPSRFPSRNGPSGPRVQ